MLVFASLVAAFVVPVGFALSLESGGARRYPLPEAATAPAAITASIVVSRSAATDMARPFSHPLVPDAAKLLILGTVLIGLAAALRKAS